MITIDSIALGSARFEGVAGVGWRGASLVSMGGIRGVLGFPTFSECLLTLDYPGAVVEGQVLGPAGEPIADARIMAYGDRLSHRSHDTISGDDGGFVDVQMDPGMKNLVGSIRNGIETKNGSSTLRTISFVDSPA